MVHYMNVSVSECGGKMHLREEEYDKAATDFFEVSKQGKERCYNS